MYVSRLSDLENARAAGFLKYVVKAPSGHIVWTELQELRVEFEFREPLWPACRQR